MDGLAPENPFDRPRSSFDAVGRLPTFRHYKSRARVWAMQCLYHKEVLGSLDASPLPDEFWEEVADVTDCPPPKDHRRSRRAAEALVSGVVSLLPSIDDLLADLSTDWSLDRMDPVDRNVMRIAVYEMALGDLPAAMAIDEAVEIGKTFGTNKSGLYINGVLDAVRKRLETPGAQLFDISASAGEPRRVEPKWVETPDSSQKETAI